MEAINILVLGDPLFGKSLLAERFAMATGNYCVIEPYIYKVMQQIDGSTIQFSLMNIPNEDIRQEDFVKANAVLMVFDEDDVESLERLQRLWTEHFEAMCESSLVILCGITSYVHRDRLFYHNNATRQEIEDFKDKTEATAYFSVDLGSQEQIFQVFDRFYNETFVPKPRKRERSLSLKSLKSLKFW
ncbi:unnamed protein product [Bursaphelenchus okinawaensis]|uniref:Uncharacterized protein n=1 Tax=Bursaphelenchus okinawaensis TaxID=465554 RepID=A0A811KP77_9BILA|nr:unnamed protein product [Bursaphelenchus okinawaensis]CAG9107495.1 unnamed protein product [Bursaphelenchus okinawaensis]